MPRLRPYRKLESLVPCPLEDFRNSGSFLLGSPLITPSLSTIFILHIQIFCELLATVKSANLTQFQVSRLPPLTTVCNYLWTKTLFSVEGSTIVTLSSEYKTRVYVTGLRAVGCQIQNQTFCMGTLYLLYSHAKMQSIRNTTAAQACMRLSFAEKN